MKVTLLLLALTLDQLKTKYRQVDHIEAKIVQTKNSPLLIRPLKTEIELRFEKGLLSWKPEGQEAWQLRFNDKGEAQFLNADKSLEQLPPAAKEKLQRSLRLIYDLMTMHPKVEENYKLDLKGQELSVASKKGEIIFQKVLLRFKADGSLDQMLLTTADDETLLQFKDLRIGRP